MDSFRELLLSARRGEAEAVDELLVRVRPWLEQAAARFSDPLRPDESTNDLVQNACVRLWNKLDQFEPGNDDAETIPRFRAWANRIVQTVGLNALRAQGNRPQPARLDPGEPQQDVPRMQNLIEDQLADDEPSVGSLVARAETAERIEAALAGLDDPLDRQILELHFVEDLSLRQVAEQLGIDREAVRRHFHAALKKLERTLGDLS